MATSGNLAAAQEERRRGEDLHLAFVVYLEVAEEQAQSWGPGVKAHWNATIAFRVELADPAISAWAADQHDLCKVS